MTDQHDNHQDGHVDGFLAGGPVHLAQFADRLAVIALDDVRFFTLLFFHRLRFLLLKRGVVSFLSVKSNPQLSLRLKRRLEDGVATAGRPGRN